MARQKRNPRKKNKLDNPLEGELIQAHVDPLPEVPAQVARDRSVTVTRPTVFTAEFEKLVELIARDRVYRMMLERRRLGSPTDEPGV